MSISLVAIGVIAVINLDSNLWVSHTPFSFPEIHSLCIETVFRRLFPELDFLMSCIDRCLGFNHHFTIAFIKAFTRKSFCVSFVRSPF